MYRCNFLWSNQGFILTIDNFTCHKTKRILKFVIRAYQNFHSSAPLIKSLFLIQTFQLPYYNSLRLLTDYFACTLWVLVNCSDGSGHILDKLTTLGVAYQKGLLTKKKSYKLILYEVELFSWKTPSHKDHLEICLPNEDFYLVL